MTSRRSRADKLAIQASLARKSPARGGLHPSAKAAALSVGALAVSALANHWLARKAERDNPPEGCFIEVDGVRLHYIERGQGRPLVLLHGNGSMIQDFETSGLLDRAAERYRVIVFDRPGYGHSERPRGTIWTPDRQAELLHRALHRIGARHSIVLGHSWGAAVAVSLALNHPEHVCALVLASGYHYPGLRPDFIASSAPALPVLGDVLRYTISPLLSRAMWPLLMRRIFGPAPVPHKFAGFPKAMALRPSQLRASAAESAILIPQAFEAQIDYARLTVPLVIIAGEDDRLVDIDAHSARLHREVPGSVLRRVPGIGHMIHQSATDDVMAAIDEAARLAQRKPRIVPLAA